MRHGIIYTVPQSTSKLAHYFPLMTSEHFTVFNFKMSKNRQRNNILSVVHSKFMLMLIGVEFLILNRPETVEETGFRVNAPLFETTWNWRFLNEKEETSTPLSIN